MYKFILPALLFTSFATAQVTKRPQKKQFPAPNQWQPPKLRLPGETSNSAFIDSANREKLKSLTRKLAALSMEWQGIFAHKTSDGSSVYILPKDNMPCIVADKSKLEKMSTGTVETVMYSVSIPNAFPQIQVIPNSGKNH